MSLRWEARCTACNAQAKVEAMIPFAREERNEIRQVDDPQAPISGFWEDYVCPDHLTVARRAVWVAERGAIDPVVAWDNYRSGVGHTTPIPRCPECRQEMTGGQWIAELPLHLAPHIELHRWIVERWHDLELLLMTQQQAIRAEELEHETALATLREEARVFNQFHEALRRQLRLNSALPPFEWYTNATWQAVPDEWSAARADLLQRRKYDGEFLGKLKRRQAIERHKPRLPCPVCGEGTLYLYEHFAG